MLAGFGQRTSASTGIHDRIFAKALYLSNGEDRLLIITTDLLCIPAPLARAVIAALGSLTGLVQDEICLCASHTHSAPLPLDAGDGAIGIARYAPVLRGALVDVGAAAIAAARKSRLRSGVGEVDLFLNRRTRGNPNIVDPRVAVLAVDDAASGAPVAVLFGVGCHPVTMGWDNMQISADFPGCAQRAIEASLPGVNALFFNTTEGNVIPRTSPNLDALDPRGYCGGGFENSVRIGEAIAGEVLRTRDASAPREVLSLQLAAHRASDHAEQWRARCGRGRKQARRGAGHAARISRQRLRSIRFAGAALVGCVPARHRTRTDGARNAATDGRVLPVPWSEPTGETRGGAQAR